MFLTLAQAKLREQVEELSEKMNSRLDVVDPAFKTIADALPKAAVEMKTAEGDLKGQKAKEALSPEQRALKLLQDAEQQYEMQVAQQPRRWRRGRRRQPDVRTTSRISSSSRWTSWRTSTRCSSAPSSRAATSRSTS